MVVKSAVRSQKYVAMRTVQGCELNIPVNGVYLRNILKKMFRMFRKSTANKTECVAR